MIKIPQISWALSGIIKDIDGSTVFSGATVRVTNIRTGEMQSQSSAADGSYLFAFTSHQNDDILLTEAKYEISGRMYKYGFATTTVDTSLEGKMLDVTMDKHVDKSALDIILRKPFQERQDLIFSPEFNAMRVVQTGFDKVQTTFARDANNLVTSMEENDGMHVKVTAFARDANNYITSISERIR